MAMVCHHVRPYITQLRKLAFLHTLATAFAATAAFSASLLPLGFLNRVQSYCTCSTASYHRMQDPASSPS
ncbi:hypothetical protein V8E54_014618 [Elaphomyces granulatus]